MNENDTLMLLSSYLSTKHKKKIKVEGYSYVNYGEPHFSTIRTIKKKNVHELIPLTDILGYLYMKILNTIKYL